MSIKYRITFGKIIKELRKSTGMSAETLSNRTGISLKSLSQIETGKVATDIEAMVALADGFGISPSELISGTAEPPAMRPVRHEDFPIQDCANRVSAHLNALKPPPDHTKNRYREPISE